MEHRWGERLEVDLAVRLGSRPYAVRTGRLIDVSVSGANIAIGADLRVLSRVQVALVLPGRFAHATPVISAYVTRRHRDGVGVEWFEFAPQAVVELLRFAGRRKGLHRLSPPDPGLMLGT
jgi:hypothetical protein